MVHDPHLWYKYALLKQLHSWPTPEDQNDDVRNLMDPCCTAHHSSLSMVLTWAAVADCSRALHRSGHLHLQARILSLSDTQHCHETARCNAVLTYQSASHALRWQCTCNTSKAAKVLKTQQGCKCLHYRAQDSAQGHGSALLACTACSKMLTSPCSVVFRGREPLLVGGRSPSSAPRCIGRPAGRC